jgi:hypothetical protein
MLVLVLLTLTIKVKLIPINTNHLTLKTSICSFPQVNQDLKLPKIKVAINRAGSPKDTTTTKNILVTTMRSLASTITLNR